jgi:hypothetical protein
MERVSLMIPWNSPVFVLCLLILLGIILLLFGVDFSG